MATNPITTSPGSTAIDMLEQLGELDARSLSPDTARKLLQFEFDGAQKARVTILSQKAQEGKLLPDERAELDEFIRVADAIAILQSRARQALKRAERQA